MAAWPPIAAAQTASLSGRIIDNQGGAINGAVVSLTSAAGPAARTTRTGVDGTFTFEEVPAGRVSLVIEAPGFERQTQTATLTATTAPLLVVLQIAGVVESVGVIASKLEEELPQIIERSGVRVQTITGVEIQNAGYYDVGQALQALVPGLFVTPKAGPFDYVTASFEGSRTNEILWLVDGVRISNRLYNGTTPLDTLPAHMVERVEILEGGQGLFYGTQSVAGVVNVVTRGFSDRTNGNVQGGGNTNGGGFVSGLVRGSADGNRFVLFGSTDDATGYEQFPASQYQPSASDRERSYNVHTFGGKYAYDFSPRVRFSATYQFIDAARLDNLQPARSGASQSGGPADQFNQRKEHIFSTKVDVAPRDTVEFFMKAYYHRWDSHWTEKRTVIGRPGTLNVVSDHDFWGFQDYGANFLAKLTPTGGLEYYAGYDFQNYSGEDAVLLIAPNTERVSAVFGQIQTTRDLLAKATLSAGVRYNAPSVAESHAVWNVTGRYDLPKSLFVRGTVGTSFRYPDAYELFAIDPTCCAGNPDLKPESSTNVNASIGGRMASGATTVDVEVVGFYRKVTDLIVDVDDGSGSGNTITANTQNAVRVHGFSLVGSASLTGSVATSLGYTYTTSKQGNQLAGGYSALPGLPSNRVNASIDIHPSAVPAGATVTALWVGEIFDNVSGFGQVPSGEYTVIDVAGRYFFDSQRRHRINVRLENLFDNRYATGHGRAFTDDGASPYLTSSLGVPRTLHVSYTFSY
jgi:vitamin B12 transporter